MKLIKFMMLAPLLTCIAVSVAVASDAALAAGVNPVQISVSGISQGYTNEELRGLIARGVEASLADDRGPPTHWVFSIAAAAGNRPETKIVGTLRSGNGHAVSGFFTSSTLGTAPSSLFVEEVREFAKRLLKG
jgi:hypothetical protein